MQHPKPSIQLSDHIKSKLRQHQPTPFSLSSNDLALSDNTDDDDNGSPSPEKKHHRRNSTFTTYAIRQSSQSESFFTNQTIHSKQIRSPKQQQLCQECLRRENFLRNEHQRLLHAYNENRKLTEQLRSEILLNRQYQEENVKLKYHVTKINKHLKEYQMNFDLIKQKFLPEQTTKSKEDVQVDQLKRLRRELQVYKQGIEEKQQDEQKQIHYYSHQNWIKKK